MEQVSSYGMLIPRFAQGYSLADAESVYNLESLDLLDAMFIASS
jgi:hypothetical protein